MTPPREYRERSPGVYREVKYIASPDQPGSRPQAGYLETIVTDSNSAPLQTLKIGGKSWKRMGPSANFPDGGWMTWIRTF